MYGHGRHGFEPLQRGPTDEKPLPAIPIVQATCSLESVSIPRRTGIDGERGTESWSPAIYRLPVLSGVVAVSLGLILALQLLLQKNDRSGGILFAPTVESFTAAQNFIYLYLPVLVTLCYSLLWAWIDLNARRLEPFYAMGRAAGAEAGASILLDYTSDFFAVVPFKAAKVRHWSVLFSSSTLIILTVGVVPFVGSIFNVETIEVTTQTGVLASGRMPSIKEQLSSMNGGIFNSAYAQAWLNATSPPFTTPEVALLPFTTDEDDGAFSDEGTITAETTAFRTTLDCEPVSLSNATSKSCDGSLSLHDSRGCSIDASIFHSGPAATTDVQFAGYTGWFDSAWSSASLDSRGCPCDAVHSNTFLAYLWLNNATAKTSGTTFLFCETSYERIRVNATIKRADQSVLSWAPLAPPSPLSISDMNTTAFDQLLSTAVAAFSESDTGLNSYLGSGDANISATYVDMDQARLSKLRPGVTFGPDLSRYALSLDKRPSSLLQDPRLLADAYQATHRLLFALAVHSMLIPEQHPERSAGSRSLQTGAVTMAPTFVLVAQCGLGFAALSAVLCFFFNRWRKIGLSSDPSSLINIAGLATSPIANIVEAGFDSTKGTPGPSFEDYIYRIQPLDKSIGHYKLEVGSNAAKHVYLTDRQHITALPVGRPSTTSSSSCATSGSHHLHDFRRGRWSARDGETPKPYRPLETRTGILLLFAGGLTLSIASICYLRHSMQQSQGLAIRIRSTFARNLVINYIPTTIGALLEAAWVVLNRLFCILQPFEDLKKGDARAGTTIGARYSTLPPQLSLIRALIYGHYTLGLICLVAVLANVVSVVFSGLFVLRLTTSDAPQAYTAMSNTSFLIDPQVRGSQLDYLYPLERNFTDNEALPPWMSPTRTFLPVNWPQAPPSFHSGPRKVRTIGIGLIPECHEGDVNVEMFPTDGPGTGHSGTIVATKLLNNSSIQCHGTTGYSLFNYAVYPNQSLSQAAHQQPFSQEMVSPLTSVSGSDEDLLTDPCGPFFAISWVRIGIVDGADTLSASTPQLPQLRHSVVTCEPRIEMADFDVLIGQDERIIDATPTAKSGDFDFGTRFAAGINNTLGRAYIEGAFDLLTDGYTLGGVWHNGTFAADWLNYLTMLKTGSTANVDPAMPPPEPRQMASIVGDILSRAFAVRLALNPQWIVDSEAETRDGFIIYTEQRLFFAPHMFELSLGLLGFNLFVAILVFFKRPGRFLMSNPNTIAATIRSFAGSTILEDIVNGRTTMDDLLSSGTRFGYGKFLGVDGRPRDGIERQSYVLELKTT